MRRFLCSSVAPFGGQIGSGSQAHDANEPSESLHMVRMRAIHAQRFCEDARARAERTCRAQRIRLPVRSRRVVQERTPDAEPDFLHSNHPVRVHGDGMQTPRGCV